METDFLSTEEKASLLKCHKLERDGRKKDRLNSYCMLMKGGVMRQ